jgi:hypothetical protein
MEDSVTTNIDLEAVKRKIVHDYCQDGLMEVVFGAYFLLIGLNLPRGTVGPFVAFFIFLAPVLQGLKKRLVYPRTGYVKLREGDPGPVPWFVLGSLVLGLVALVIVLIVLGIIGQPAQWYRWMPIFFGIWMAGSFLGLGLAVRMARYYIVAGILLIGGPALTLLSLPAKLGHIGMFFAAMGALLLGIGGISFLLFVRRYPVVAEEAGDVLT